jgi:hypothetical protein
MISEPYHSLSANGSTHIIVDLSGGLYVAMGVVGAIMDAPTTYWRK